MGQRSSFFVVGVLLIYKECDKIGSLEIDERLFPFPRYLFARS